MMRRLITWMSVPLLFTACNGGAKKENTMSNTIGNTAPAEWMKQTNIYEVNVRQYTPEGTLNAFAQHLPRLKEMGVGVVWFMPIYPIGITNRKETLGSYYSIKDYKAINPEFGNLDDFKAIVKQAHELGMKVVLDWVANHTSWDNAWVTQHPDYYAKDSSGHLYAPFDWSDVVQLNHKSMPQQDAMIDAMAFWVNECGIDGFRCDMAHLAPVDFWVKARTRLDAIRPLFWLAETQDTPYYKAFDVVYGWEWLHKMEDYYKGKTGIAGLDSVLQHYQHDYANNKFRILFTTNHDENSWQGTEFDRYGDAARPFAALCATLPGIPLVYGGQEEPLRHKLNFFNKDTIGFNRYEWQPFFKALLQLRKRNTALAADSSTQFIRLNTTANDKIYAFIRKNGTQEVFVIANLSTTGRFTFEVNDERLTGAFKNIFNGAANDFTSEKSFLMNAWDFVVYEK
jgi:alpha-amylase